VGIRTSLPFTLYPPRQPLSAGGRGAAGCCGQLSGAARFVSAIGGFSPTSGKFEGGHGEGITSVSEGDGRLYLTDRTSLSLLVVDPASKKIAARTKLSANPDYVRFVRRRAAGPMRRRTLLALEGAD